MATVTKNKVLAISVGLLIAGLAIGAMISIYTVPPREVVTTTTTTTATKEIVTTTKEVPREVVTTTTTSTTVTTTTTTTKEVIMKLPDLVKKIQNGEIDVGKDYGMAINQRYHKIHATTLGLTCLTCHVTKVTPEMTFVQVPPEAPGPVDRRVCIGCHLTGPASNLYGP